MAEGKEIPFRTGLFVHNSISKKNDEFIPIKGRTVNWYTCGPTVYDVSHMGHARNYLTFDIVRRIMESYFNYDVRVFYCCQLLVSDERDGY